jgi:hypothetical protein
MIHDPGFNDSGSMIRESETRKENPEIIDTGELI